MDMQAFGIRRRAWALVAGVAVLAGLLGPGLGRGGGSAHADIATEGSLRVLGPEGRPLGFCPLKHTDVVVDISGFVARVTLTQQFENPYEIPIEAVYTFPMSDRGAVDAMTMRIGDRVVKGKIDRKEVARKIYQAARAAGQTASLLDQERPNIFTQSVANIMPGSTIEIEISYVEYLKYDAGEYAYSFPMVVGPRYIPGAQDCIVPEGGTNQVPDASRISPPVTPKGTRAGHDISLKVNLNAGVAIQGIESDLHEVSISRRGTSLATIELKNKQSIPNRDFVLRYAVADKGIGDAVLTHAGEKGKFFSLILQPPDRVTPETVSAKEMIFVIDCSGSMSGFPIEKAKMTMRLAIEGMNPSDTFNLVTFAGGVGYCFEKPVLNTAANRATALRFLSNLQGGGGTEMMKAIHAALGNQNDPERLRIVAFMTDGFIGNDMAILDAIQKHRQNARVFAFGIGNGVNRFLIENMGREGRGASDIVTLESDGDAAAKRFHERIQSPVLTDISVNFGGLQVVDVSPDPAAIPDLFASRPLILTGRYTDSGTGFVTVRGNTANGPFERKIRVEFPEQESQNDVLASLWARERIDALYAQDWMGTQLGNPDKDVREKVTQLGLDYGLLTQFTSFVAVEERVVNEGGRLVTVDVPVEMTDGVSYEGVFGTNAPGRRAGLGGAQFRIANKSVAQNVAQPSSVSAQSVQRMQALGYLTADSEVAAAPRERGERDVDEAFVDRLSKMGENERLDDQRILRRELVEPKDKKDVSYLLKIDPALRGIGAKLNAGEYHRDGVTVSKSRVEVFIRLLDDSEATLAVLKELGIEIVSHTRASKTLYARVSVLDLDQLAKLDFVRLIEPARF